MEDRATVHGFNVGVLDPDNMPSDEPVMMPGASLYDQGNVAAPAAPSRTAMEHFEQCACCVCGRHAGR